MPNKLGPLSLPFLSLNSLIQNQHLRLPFPFRHILKHSLTVRTSLTSYKNYNTSTCWWLTPVILAPLEAEVWSQPQANSLWYPSLKTPNTKQGWQSGPSGRARDPQFKPQYH
jgi:hypothetical protein